MYSTQGERYLAEFAWIYLSVLGNRFPKIMLSLLHISVLSATRVDTYMRES